MTKTTSNRDRKSGQYVHMAEALCGCGHSLGKHAAACVNGERPCFNGDLGGEPCDCTRFRKAR